MPRRKLNEKLNLVQWNQNLIGTIVSAEFSNSEININHPLIDFGVSFQAFIINDSFRSNGSAASQGCKTH